MRRWQTRGAFASLLLTGLALSACSDGDQKGAGAKASDDGGRQSAFTRAQADSVIPVTVTGYNFEGAPSALKGPKVFFEVKNDGSSYHEFSVIGAVDGKERGAIEPLEAGEMKSLAVELPPGNYIARCMIKFLDTPYADVGMLSRFTVE